MSFLKPIQWYHSPADPIWPNGTFKDQELRIRINLFLFDSDPDPDAVKLAKITVTRFKLVFDPTQTSQNVFVPAVPVLYFVKN
jgi:hypothetical protein